MSIVSDTYEELGLKNVRPQNFLLFVRTDAISRTTEGGIYLTDKQVDFYTTMPHLITVYATVIATCKNSPVGIGDKVAFARLHFNRYQKMTDGTLTGFVNFNDLIGVVD